MRYRWGLARQWRAMMRASIRRPSMRLRSWFLVSPRLRLPFTRYVSLVDSGAAMKECLGEHR